MIREHEYNQILRQLLPPTSLGNALVVNKEEFEFLRYGLKGYVLWYLFEQCPQVLAVMLARCLPQRWPDVGRNVGLRSHGTGRIFDRLKIHAFRCSAHAESP